MFPNLQRLLKYLEDLLGQLTVVGLAGAVGVPKKVIHDLKIAYGRTMYAKQTSSPDQKFPG